MKSTTFVLFLIFIGAPVFAQNDTGVNDPIHMRDSTNIIETIERHKPFRGSSVEPLKWVTRLNEKGIVTSRSRYDEKDTLTQETILYFDTTGKVVRLTTYNTDQLSEMPLHSVTEYQYNDAGLMVSSITKDLGDSVYWWVKYRYDEKNRIIESKYLKIPPLLRKIVPGWDRDSIFYDDKNKDSTDYTLATNGGIIMSVGPMEYEVRRNGDVDNGHDKVFKVGDTEYEYVYDKKGNWINLTAYVYTKTGRIKDYEKECVITYRR